MSNRRRQQGGFTLLELVAAVAIVAAMGSVITTVIFHEVRGTAAARNEVAASIDTGEAGRWISRDSMSAESTDLVDGAPPVDQLTLSWTEWYELTGVSHVSTYSLSGTDLKRDFDGVVTTVARNISNVAFSQADRVVTVEITSIPPWTTDREEERTYKVYLRPRG